MELKNKVEEDGNTQVKYKYLKILSLIIRTVTQSVLQGKFRYCKSKILIQLVYPSKSNRVQALKCT